MDDGLLFILFISQVFYSLILSRKNILRTLTCTYEKDVFVFISRQLLIRYYQLQVAGTRISWEQRVWYAAGFGVEFAGRGHVLAHWLLSTSTPASHLPTYMPHRVSQTVYWALCRAAVLCESLSRWPWCCIYRGHGDRRHQDLTAATNSSWGHPVPE